MKKRALIAGCGYLGMRIAERLARRGHEVHGLRRSATAMPAGVRLLQGDLGDPATLEGIAGEIDWLIYAAAADERSAAAYRRAYVEGPENLVRAFAKRGARPERVIVISSTGVYGDSAGEWVDEATPARPTEETGELLLRGEGVFAAAGWETIIFRLAGIYGPGRARMIELARLGKGWMPAGRVHYANRIHVDDAAAATVHLLEHPRPEGLYIGVDDEPADYNETLSWLAERMGAKGARGSGAEETGPFPARGNKRCRNGRLRASGYQFIHPTYREGFEALLREAQGEPARAG